MGNRAMGIFEETQRDQPRQKLRFRKILARERAMGLGNRVSGFRLTAIQGKAHLAPPEIPPAVGICQVCIVWGDRAENGPELIVGVFAAERLEAGEQSRRASRPFFGEPKSIFSSLSLQSL